jgi:zinc transporter ZupT
MGRQTCPALYRAPRPGDRDVADAAGILEINNFPIVPAAFALGSVLLQKKISKNAIVLFLAIFAIMCPLGYWISYVIGHSNIAEISNYFDSMMGIVIGIFLHISTTILFESSVDHKFNIKKLIAVCLGVAIALVGFLLEA